MSLQLWMPLMGDLRNQGLGDYSISSLGTISWVTGKLSSQAMRAGDGTQVVNGIRIEDTFTDLLNGDYSVSVWVKPYGNHVHYNGSIFSSGNWNTPKKRWAFGVSQDNTKVDILCSAYNTYVTCAVPVNEWTHLVCTCGSDRIVKLYKNGEYITSVDRSASNVFDSDNVFTCIGRESYANGYFSFNGAIQDFRLYDHCLSLMEVKQLSQGLVLHYPLDRQGFGQENLITQTMIDAEPWKSAIQGNYTKDGKNCWILSNNILYSKSGSGANNIFSGLTYEANTQYTISFKWRDDYRTDGKTSSLYIRFKYSDGTYTQVICPKCSYWKEEVMTSTAGKTVSAITTTYGNGGYLLFTDLKLEKGTVKTPTSPIVNSDLYNSMGLNSTTEYDCSGFYNNGTRTGTFEWTSNTPKYAVSQVFNGSNNAIQTPSLPTMITDKNYTIAVWIYKTVIGSKGYQTIYGGPSGFEIEARNGSANETKFVPWNWGKPMASYELNEWNHCVFVHSDSDCKIYLNGEYIATGTAKTSNPTGNYFIGAWNTATQQNFDGLMSDFRIYATALSAEDVKSLYQNCATIDPDGTIRGQIRS